ncbi:unnamed protein product [Symbiodinium sp. CCMP2592]|nr:unnamed protein product [Symbiodinium sp. CCMP2592]
MLKLDFEISQETGLAFKTLFKTVLNSLKSAVEVEDCAGHFAPRLLNVSFSTHKPVAEAKKQRVQSRQANESTIQATPSFVQPKPINCEQSLHSAYQKQNSKNNVLHAQTTTPPATTKTEPLPSYGVSHLPPWSRNVARAKEDSTSFQRLEND